MGSKYIPEFAHKYVLIDGSLCEKYFINNKEVNSKTYYSLLEDNVTHGKKSVDTDIQDEDGLSNYDHISILLDRLFTMNNDEAIDFLTTLLVLQYKIGYHIGQMDLSDKYANRLLNNSKKVKKSLDSLLNTYDNDL